MKLGCEAHGDSRPCEQQAAQEEDAVEKGSGRTDERRTDGVRGHRRADGSRLLVPERRAQLAQVDAHVAFVGEEEPLQVMHHLVGRRKGAARGEEGRRAGWKQRG